MSPLKKRSVKKKSVKKKPTKRKLVKNPWEDHYTRKARKENYAARSVYKLAEIQKKHKVINRGDRVLDLGCAPGSWLQFAVEQAGEKGRVIGVDLQPVTVRLPDNAHTLVGDVYQWGDIGSQLLQTGFQVILSDMAPATTGSKFSDAVRSYELCRAALEVADQALKPGGRFVCKIFQGEDFKTFCDQVKHRFAKMKIFKPQSSRKASSEIFIIGLGKN